MTRREALDWCKAHGVEIEERPHLSGWHEAELKMPDGTWHKGLATTADKALSNAVLSAQEVENG